MGKSYLVLLRGETVQIPSAVSEKVHSTQNRKSEKAINAAYQSSTKMFMNKLYAVFAVWTASSPRFT